MSELASGPPRMRRLMAPLSHLSNYCLPLLHNCTTPQLHNCTIVKLHNPKPLSCTTNRKALKHLFVSIKKTLMTKITLLIDNSAFWLAVEEADVRRRRWLFVGPYSFIHSALLLLASVAILFTLTPWIFTKCAVALQFVYVWVYLVFVLSWICPSGREEDMPAMPYTYFWSTSHGGVRITTHCARCALCKEIETMPHSDKKEEGSEAMQWGLGQNNIHTTILRNLPVWFIHFNCASPVRWMRFW